MDRDELGREGEAPVAKRCVFCGVGQLTLAWRSPLDDAHGLTVTTPLGRPGWWPTVPALDARLTCAACGNLSYGRLVGGHRTAHGTVDGHFVLLPPGQTLIAW